MTHYWVLVILAASVAVIFAMAMKETWKEIFRYFLSLVAYMILGSLIAAWIMYSVP